MESVGKINLTDNIYRGYHQHEHATIYPGQYLYFL
mgnify:CR=1 FL=1